MSEIVRILLPVYFLVYFGLAFVLKSLMVARRTGKNPLVLPKDDSAYGLIGFYFKIVLITMFLYTVVYFLHPTWFEAFSVLPDSIITIFRYLGLTLLAASLIWTLIAQHHMRDSWRIGIDNDNPTELVTDGLFRYSRNPFFLGMLLSLCGLFFITSDGWSGLFFIVGYILIQVQVRLEEEFLTRQHGEKYRNYLLKVRRFI